MNQSQVINKIKQCLIAYGWDGLAADVTEHNYRATFKHFVWCLEQTIIRTNPITEVQCSDVKRRRAYEKANELLATL